MPSFVRNHIPKIESYLKYTFMIGFKNRYYRDPVLIRRSLLDKNNKKWKR